MSSSSSFPASLQPADFSFVASRRDEGTRVARVLLTNTSTVGVAYKLKTNAADRYAVKPVFGQLKPNESADIYARCDGAVKSSDRFMVQIVKLEGALASSTVDADFWKKVQPALVLSKLIQCLEQQPSDQHQEKDSPRKATSATSSKHKTKRSSSSSSPFVTVFLLGVLGALVAVLVMHQDQWMPQAQRLLSQAQRWITALSEDLLNRTK